MSGKSKFQISRSLDERIKKIIIDGIGEHNSEFSQVNSAFILGYNYGNVTNFVGLTKNYHSYNASLPVVGLVFFESTPTEGDIRTYLESIEEYSNSPVGFGRFKSDENAHLFLIYTVDEESRQLVKRIFDKNASKFLEVQPKLSVLDEPKIYNHSILTKLTVPMKLDILKGSEKNKLTTKDNIISALESVKGFLAKDSKDVKIHLLESNFSMSPANGGKNLTETLYEHLDPPNDIHQMGDYLPQMTKEDKKKLVDKWHNKVKNQRAPLEFKLEHESLDFFDGELLPEQYGFHLETFLYLQANDPISKSIQIILYSLRKQIDILSQILIERAETSIEPNELKSCTFKPAELSHLVQSIYAIPTSNSSPNYEKLKEFRSQLHLNYLLPLNKPLFRYSQRVMNLSMSTLDEQAGLLCNVHTEIQDNSGIKGGSRKIIEGSYTYHHYMQNRINDNGWGCAYRSLQTIISWFKHQGYIYSPDVELRATETSSSVGDVGGANNELQDKTSSLRKRLHLESRVPTHEEIQLVLVATDPSKQPSFIGSQKWIGSQEVFYVLSYLYNLDCKFISVSSGSELVSKARDFCAHFEGQSTPIMVGGGVLAHTMIGVDFNDKNGDISYLILDPHYTGSEDLSTITKKGWCGWKKNNFWDKSAFYNLCLPQRPSEF